MSDERRDIEATDVKKDALRKATDGNLDLPRPVEGLGDRVREGIDAIGGSNAGAIGKPNPEDEDDDLGPGGPRMTGAIGGLKHEAVGGAMSAGAMSAGAAGRPNPEDEDDDPGPGGPRIRDVIKGAGPEAGQG